MNIEVFFEQDSSALTYICYTSDSESCVIIDPVLNYDALTGKLRNTEVQKYCEFIKEKKLKLKYILETHIHADHMSSAGNLKEKFPEAKLVVSERIDEVQDEFFSLYGMDNSFKEKEIFDLKIKDGEVLDFSCFKIQAIQTPGHTPACCSYLIESKNLFCGDSLFMPDFGTGRCDFPGGDAAELFSSIKEKVYSLDESTEVYVGHDYRPGGRELAWKTTVKESREKNIHINAQTSVSDFVSFREGRDKGLNAPRLLLPSLQVNLLGGVIPFNNFLKIPINKEY